MTTDEIRRHCEQIDRCNQRGGRMLSIVDLLEAGTFTTELAAYALAAISDGASFLVGAGPGGAGKTTVMGALLNFVPPDVELVTADGAATIAEGLGAQGRHARRCYICHEIGDGAYYAYLWGKDLRAYFDLPSEGHMLATNLHADTFEQAHHQICVTNQVSETALRRVHLMFFLAVRRSGWDVSRHIDTVWVSDGVGGHRQVFQSRSPSWSPNDTDMVAPARLAWARQTIDELRNDNARTTEHVRRVVVEAFGRFS
ncbi:MAG TPA: hypothetical protein VMZ31_06215 [Phycisphaerae bacterium]|nr:hypothetical protein [Phycisphaerae bacterium]